jgi:hypothetical protein
MGNKHVIQPRSEKERLAFWAGYDQAVKDVQREGIGEAIKFRAEMAEMELRINTELKHGPKCSHGR